MQVTPPDPDPMEVAVATAEAAAAVAVAVTAAEVAAVEEARTLVALQEKQCVCHRLNLVWLSKAQ